jgi:hypothetical protein
MEAELGMGRAVQPEKSDEWTAAAGSQAWSARDGVWWTLGARADFAPESVAGCCGAG